MTKKLNQAEEKIKRLRRMELISPVTFQTDIDVLCILVLLNFEDFSISTQFQYQVSNCVEGQFQTAHPTTLIYSVEGSLWICGCSFKVSDLCTSFAALCTIDLLQVLSLFVLYLDAQQYTSIIVNCTEFDHSYFLFWLNPGKYQ